MDAVTSYGQQFPVSVWMKKVSSTDSSIVIVIIEPVERSSAHFAMSREVRCAMSCKSVPFTCVSCECKYTCAHIAHTIHACTWHMHTHTHSTNITLDAHTFVASNVLCDAVVENLRVWRTGLSPGGQKCWEKGGYPRGT